MSPNLNDQNKVTSARVYFMSTNKDCFVILKKVACCVCTISVRVTVKRKYCTVFINEFRIFKIQPKMINI